MSTPRVKSAAFFGLLLVIFVLPLGVLALYMFAPGWKFPDVVPQSFDGRAVGYALEQGPRIGRHLAWSVGYSLVTVVLAFALCVVPAKLFARREFPGKALLEGLFLAPALVPVMTFSMGVQVAFIRVGLADTLAGVVLVLTVFAAPYMFRALVGGYGAVSPRYDVCAKNLGAGWWTRLWRVEVPLILPAALAGGSVVFLVAFSEYFLVFLIGGGVVESYATYIFPFLGESDRALASLLTLLFLVAPVTLFVVLELTVLRLYRRMGLY